MPENENSSKETNAKQSATPSEPVSFPWMMLVLAAVFDLIGIIPIVNLLTELLAGFIIGLWQASYAPKTDPLTTFFLAKILDICTLGFLPSNIAIIVYAYIKKKAAVST